MRSQRHIAEPAVKARIADLRRLIDRCHRLDGQMLRQFRRQKALKQCRLEGQHAAAVGAGAFGKEQQPMTCRRARGELARLFAGQFRIARHEMRIGHPRQDIDAGPRRHLGFRDEEHRHCRVQHQNVEPAGMIGDDRARAGHGLALTPPAKAQDPQTDPAHALHPRAGQGPARPPDQPLDRAQRQDQQHTHRQNRQDAHAARGNQQPAERTDCRQRRRLGDPASRRHVRRCGLGLVRRHCACQRAS